MKKVFFFLGSFVLFALIFHPTQTAAHVLQVYTIKVTDQGFSPNTITITQGDTVVFENMSKSPAWPASNIHPSHQIYPEFDPRKPIMPGKHWQFLFIKNGSWKLHDHLNPQVVGTIIVRKDAHFASQNDKKESFNPYLKIKIVAAKLYYFFFPQEQKKFLQSVVMHKVTENKSKEAEQSLLSLLRIFGPKTLMNDLLADTDNGALTDCHQPAHKIGRLAYELYGATVFKDGSYACHSGYYHGAMEAMIREKGVDNLPATITKLCNSFDSSFGVFQCFHGVGHGILAYEDYDLPAALNVCGQLDTGRSRSGCYGGAFMENIMLAQGRGANPGHKTQWLSQDPYFPCNKVSQDATIQYDCWQMQTSWMRTLFHENGEKIVETCSKAPSKWIYVCFRSWGRDIASFTLRNPEKIATGCNAVPKIANYYDECISGGLNVIIDFWGNKLTDQATDLCDLVQTEPHRKLCYQDVARRLSDIFSSQSHYNHVCKFFDPKYTYLCSKS